MRVCVCVCVCVCVHTCVLYLVHVKKKYMGQAGVSNLRYFHLRYFYLKLCKTTTGFSSTIAAGGLPSQSSALSDDAGTIVARCMRRCNAAQRRNPQLPMTESRCVRTIF